MRLRMFLVLVLSLAASRCGGGSQGVDTAHQGPAPFRFAVFSDPHLHDAATLGAGGPDWDAYLAKDRKLLKESAEIQDSVIERLLALRPDAVMVSGDLTKDGELANHQFAAAKLGRLRSAGIKVFVVPGNHDIANPRALNFTVSPAVPTPTVSPAEFRQVYADCGFNGALSQDPSSLSYVAEPVPGLWLLALDSCDYANNQTQGAPVTAGRLTAATQTWALARLQEARQKGKLVIGLMHHGLVEHFAGQAQKFPAYLLSNAPMVGKSLADNGMNLVFTGHFHANDITAQDFGSSRLVDCETGSLVTAPCPYRTASLDLAAGRVDIRTETVAAIPSHPSDFLAYSSALQRQGLTDATMAQLTRAPYYLDSTRAAQATPWVVGGMMAHFAGDENLTDPATRDAITEMLSSKDFVMTLLGQWIQSLWTDLPPKDTSASLVLK
ncbi:MAG: metallophosphoesterase [Acidobacteria bacterium]|nr:metallophosphoesterase [Acidobacteriota bacterium]